MTKHDAAIYLDMDGVFANFDKKAGTLYNEFGEMLELWHQGINNRRYKDMYVKLLNSIQNCEDFWLNLEWQPGGEELFSFVTQTFHKDQLAVLTAPMQGDVRCRPQKWQWVQEKFGETISEDRFICHHLKHTFVGKLQGTHQILIDDRRKNIDNWRKAGGTGILHTCHKKTIEELKTILNI